MSTHVKPVLFIGYVIFLLLIGGVLGIIFVRHEQVIFSYLREYKTYTYAYAHPSVPMCADGETPQYYNEYLWKCIQPINLLIDTPQFQSIKLQSKVNHSSINLFFYSIDTPTSSTSTPQLN